MKTSHEYRLPARVLWEHATLWPNLMLTSLDAIDYSGLPQGRMQTGQVVSYKVRGGLPLHEFEWVARLIEVDHARMIMRTQEHGGPITTYRHTLSVVGTERGCRMTDDLEIEAGLLTVPAWLNAWLMHRRRHARRETLLARRPAAAPEREARG
ncbi:MAG: hypothetical protein ACQEUZ_12930 [Pseudomonadota bacterium]